MKIPFLYEMTSLGSYDNNQKYEESQVLKSKVAHQYTLVVYWGATVGPILYTIHVYNNPHNINL